MIRFLVVLSCFVAALVVAPGAPRPARADTLTLANTYAVTGTNPDGSAYKGTVNIKILSNTTFAIKWEIAGATYTGFGMRRNDSLAATYTINGEPGLVVYGVDGNGLDGLWAIRGQNGSGTEHLTPTD